MTHRISQKNFSLCQTLQCDQDEETLYFYITLYEKPVSLLNHFVGVRLDTIACLFFLNIYTVYYLLCKSSVLAFDDRTAVGYWM